MLKLVTTVSCLSPREGRYWLFSHQCKRNGRVTELKYVMERVDINNRTLLYYGVEEGGRREYI